MGNSMMRTVTTLDIGGGTIRDMQFNIEGSRVSRLGVGSVTRLKLGSAHELIERSTAIIKENLREGQAIVPVSIAGPVDTDGGRILKLTNHTGVEEKDIPFCAEVGSRLGSKVAVKVINDGEAGA
ncbi:MAG: hypothetical protein WC527_07015 [Candidatus Margulisiibacteriota bacterium]